MKAHKTSGTTMKVLFLETQMDKNINSKRSQIRYMKELISNIANEEVEVITKEIHTLKGLEKFLDYARKDKDIVIVHITAHGLANCKSCSLFLTKDEEIKLTHKKNQEMFKNLKGKIIFFSACQIASNEKVMEEILSVSKANAIFGYGKDVSDAQAIMIESLFYHFIFADTEAELLKTIYHKLVFASDYLEIDRMKAPLVDTLLRFYY